MPTTTTTPLQEARNRIDEIDRRFVELLAERYEVVDEICEMKERDNDSVKDADREAELLDHVSAIAEEHGVSPELVQRLYEEILSHSVERQRERRQKEQSDDSQPAPSRSGNGTSTV